MKRIQLVIVLLLASQVSNADVLGVYGGIGYWNVNYSGDSIDNVSLAKDFNISSDNGGFIYLAFEHPIPLLPNIRVAHTQLKDGSTSVLGNSFVFNGTPFNVNDLVDTEFDLTHTDLTLYYELVDIGFDLDVGVTGRYFSGEVSVGNVKEDVQAVMPLLYISSKVGLPFSGLYAGAVVNGSVDILDYQLKVGWETENFILPEFGVELGYRSFAIDAGAGDVDVKMDAKTDGVFVSLVGHF